PGLVAGQRVVEAAQTGEPGIVGADVDHPLPGRQAVGHEVGDRGAQLGPAVERPRGVIVQVQAERTLDDRRQPHPRTLTPLVMAHLTQSDASERERQCIDRHAQLLSTVEHAAITGKWWLVDLQTPPFALDREAGWTRAVS